MYVRRSIILYRGSVEEMLPDILSRVVLDAKGRDDTVAVILFEKFLV